MGRRSRSSRGINIMLPPGLSQSVQRYFAASSHAFQRVILSPARVRVVGAAAALNLSPRLSAHSRSCSSWSPQHDRNAARAQQAQARLARRNIRERMIRHGSLPAVYSLRSYPCLYQLRWGSSSSESKKTDQVDGPSKGKADQISRNPHEGDRYEDDLFELSEVWRAKSDALRKWIEQNPYDALFGYSNKLGRFERGSLLASISRWTSLEPADCKLTGNAAQPKSPTHERSSKPSEVPNAANQTASGPQIPVPAKPTKMGHASSTPRTSTILSEAELVYDPISNRMVRSGSGEFSHYAQELDVGAKRKPTAPIVTRAPQGAAEAQTKPTQSANNAMSTSEEYARYKSKRLPPQKSGASWLANEGFSAGHRGEKTSSSALGNEQRAQIAHRAKLERNFDKAQTRESGKIDLPVRKTASSHQGTALPQATPATEHPVNANGIETALERHLARKAQMSKKMQTSLDRHSRSWYPPQTPSVGSGARQAADSPESPDFEDYLTALGEAGGARGKSEKLQHQPSSSDAVNSNIEAALHPEFEDYMDALSEPGAARNEPKDLRPRQATNIKAKSATQTPQHPDFEDYMNALNEAGGARNVPCASVRSMPPKDAEQRLVESHLAPGFEHYLAALSEAGAARKPAVVVQSPQKVLSDSAVPTKSKDAPAEADEVEFASMDEPFVIESSKKVNDTTASGLPEPVVATKSTSAVAEPTSSSTYTVLAYDQMTNQVTSAEMAAPASTTEAVTPLSTALMQLKEPAKFLPHLEKIKGKGFEVVSCGENLLILKRDVGVPETEAVKGSQPIESDISAASTKPDAHVPTGDFASPTGFINWNNYETLPEGALSKPPQAAEKATTNLESASASAGPAQPSLPGYPRSKHSGPFCPRRMEPVFSGSKHHRRSAEWKRLSRRPRRFWRFVKRIAVTLGFSAAVLYVAGLIMQMRRDTNEGRMVWDERRTGRRSGISDDRKPRE